MAHALLSGSTAKQWSTCPGSAVLRHYASSAGIKEDHSPHAALGTAAHALVERCLREGSAPEDYRDRIVLIVDNGDGTSILKSGARVPKDPMSLWFPVDTDMIDAVTVMTEYVTRRRQELGVSSERLLLEHYSVPLPDRDDTGGTADVVIDGWPDLLEIVDYKHGAGVHVPVVGNYQLRSYMLGVARDMNFSHDMYRYTIVQPRHPNGGVSYEEISRAELIHWGEELKAAAERVDKAFITAQEAEPRTLHDLMEALHRAGELSTGEDGDHCTFCVNKTNCPAVLRTVQEAAGVDFKCEVPPELVPFDASVGGDEIARLLVWVPLLDSWIKSIKAAGEAVLFAGGTVPGYKLVRKRSNRQWVEMEQGELLDGLERDFSIDRKLMLQEPKLITGPQALKLVTGKGCISVRKEMEAKYMFKPIGGLTMVPEDDKRPSVQPDPSSDFIDGQDGGATAPTDAE